MLARSYLPPLDDPKEVKGPPKSGFRCLRRVNAASFPILKSVSKEMR